MHFRIALSSVFIASFAFVIQMLLGYAHTLIYFSDKDITHSRWRVLIQFQYVSGISGITESSSSSVKLPDAYERIKPMTSASVT